MKHNRCVRKREKGMSARVEAEITESSADDRKLIIRHQIVTVSPLKCLK